MGLETLRPALQSVGSYDLLERIAEGGMGAIYKGRNRATGEIVAVKVMPPHTANNPTLLKRFEQEFRAASRLDHPNVVRALDYGHDGSTPYMVMEFVEGESLGQKIERDGALPEARAIQIIAQVAQGLHKAHKQNLVHRDVKPDNILVRSDGVAKLADLGLVKETETDLNLTKTGRGLGTPHFMAPEQFRDAKNADARCDIYSLGATLYMMVTGELPFRSSGPLEAWMKKMQNDLTAPRQIVPALSERVDWAILRAMSAERENRPASCREFIEDLTGKSTRRAPIISASAQDTWYLVYQDEHGITHTVRGSTQVIRRSLAEGKLGDASTVRASRTKSGPFEPLRDIPEFRDKVIVPAPLSPVSPSRARPIAPPSSAPARSRAAAPVQVAPAPVVEPRFGPEVPRIALGSEGDEAGEAADWVKWIFLFLAIFAVSATLAFYLIPIR